MEQDAVVFCLLGATFLLGLAADAFGRRTRLPRVTMLLAIGFLVGPGALDLLPPGYETLYERGADIALTMVGFLLGERLVLSIRGGEARAVMWISVSAVIITAVVVGVGLVLIGTPLPVALLLAGIATATAPAATMDVVRQCGAKGALPDTLLGVVAVDDAWGLLGFSLLMAVAKMLLGGAGSVWEPLAEGGWEIGGAILIGSVLGAIMAVLTGRVEKGEPTLLEAVGFVFLACGLSIASHVSFILTAMVMGSTVAICARHHERPFHTVENIELPFMILFFMLAGASLDLGALTSIGWVGVVYVICRILGRMGGGWVGASLAGSPSEVRRGLGMGLMPQAGVAIGMALVAEQKFPEYGETILQVAIGSTVFFELIGPLMTQWALRRAEMRTGEGVER